MYQGAYGRMGLQQDILNQPVSELELRKLITVSPDATTRQAVAMMREKQLGCVVAIDAQGKPLGKFTERQLTKLLLDSPGGLDQPVSRHLAKDWACVTDADSISKVIDNMQSRKLRFVVICDPQGKAVALTGQRGVMEYIADHFPRQVKVQRMKSDFFKGERDSG